MKQALALIFLSCVLVAQEEGKQVKSPTSRELMLGAAASPSVAKEPNPAAAETIVKNVLKGDSRKRVEPIHVRDELIELIHQLKKEANESPSSLWGKVTVSNQVVTSAAIAEYEAKAKAKTEAQRLLLQALVELAKEVAKDKPTKAWHSSLPPEPGEDGNWFRSK